MHCKYFSDEGFDLQGNIRFPVWMDVVSVSKLEKIKTTWSNVLTM